MEHFHLFTESCDDPTCYRNKPEHKVHICTYCEAPATLEVWETDEAGVRWFARFCDDHRDIADQYGPWDGQGTDPTKFYQPA